MSTNRPFGRSSISLRLYPHNELPAQAVVSEILEQARLGLSHGFDGIMTSEHHGGFPGYLPNPLQITTFILESNPSGWAAPCPLLLPLRPTALVAEEVAWLHARHPGRVGIGVGAGALPLDFEEMGMNVADAVPRFKAELPRLVAMLRGEDLRGLAGDKALLACAAEPVTVLSAAVSPAAARRAARCGAGILSEGMSTVERLGQICDAYTEAGGSGPMVLIRRVWLGEADKGAIERQRAVYQGISSASGPRSFGADETVSTADPSEMAERLADVLSSTGADAINLRVHLPGIPAEAIRDQIERLATEVLPHLRALM